EMGHVVTRWTNVDGDWAAITRPRWSAGIVATRRESLATRNSTSCRRASMAVSAPSALVDARYDRNTSRRRCDQLQQLWRTISGRLWAAAIYTTLAGPISAPAQRFASRQRLLGGWPAAWRAWAQLESLEPELSINVCRAGTMIWTSPTLCSTGRLVTRI